MTEISHIFLNKIFFSPFNKKCTLDELIDSIQPFVFTKTKKQCIEKNVECCVYPILCKTNIEKEKEQPKNDILFSKSKLMPNKAK
jgi:hypothetical protein